MTNIAFLLNFPKEYKGGINYFKNLMYAISKVESHFNVFLFVPENLEQEYIDLFSPYATIVRTKVLNRKSFPWIVEKVIERLLHRNVFLLRILKEYKINVVSHSNFFHRDKDIKVINWIPDFQSLHYPKLWSDKDLKDTLNLYHKIVKYSDKVVLSSYDALKDFKTFAPNFVAKAHVLQFVSQPDEIEVNDDTVAAILVKHGIKRNFFYLPNQFWSHKNHITAFKAIKILKDKGLNPLLVTSGFMMDYRTNNETFNILNNYIIANELSENILLLGLIPYQDVLTLFKSAIAILNPSLFEGWSSSVEESKSVGQTIVLSDIPVHREQNPSKGIYFDPAKESDLAVIMENILQSPNQARSASDVALVKQNLIDRTVNFGQNYVNLVNDIRA